MYVHVYGTCCTAFNQKAKAKKKASYEKLRDRGGRFNGLLDMQQGSTTMLVHTPVWLLAS